MKEVNFPLSALPSALSEGMMEDTDTDSIFLNYTKIFPKISSIRATLLMLMAVPQEGPSWSGGSELCRAQGCSVPAELPSCPRGPTGPFLVQAAALQQQRQEYQR
jgi:hypothetical protein